MQRPAGIRILLPKSAVGSRPYQFLTSADIDHFGSDFDPKRANAVKGGVSGPPKMVGAHLPNPFGLYNMHGNVAEWCQDRLTADYSDEGAAKVHPEFREDRVSRGGNFGDKVWWCRSAARRGFPPERRDLRIGFRVACTVIDPAR